MHDFNFFVEYERKKGGTIDMKSPVFLGILAILIIVLLSGGSVGRTMILKAKLTNMTERVNELQTSPEYQKSLVLQKSMSLLSEYDQNVTSSLEKINRGNTLSTVFLDRLAASIPSNISMRSANLSRTECSFDFLAPSRKAAAELMKSLDASGLFLKTTLQSVVSDQAESGGFMVYVHGILKAGEIQ